MNVVPANYSWPEFYSRIINSGKHTFSWNAIVKRLIATKSTIPRWMNVVRGISYRRFGRIKFNEKIYRQLQSENRFVIILNVKLPNFRNFM